MDSISNQGASADNSDKLPAGRHLLFWIPAAVGCAVDLVTKHWVFDAPNLRGGAVWWLWEGHAGIQQSLNEGALFGMGQGKVWLFALFSLAALAAIPVWLFRYRAAHDRWLTFTLGCIVGGILGNLYDRLGLHGLQWEQFIANRNGQVYAVRDWVLWCWDFNAGIIWPNFNVADALLVCGAGSLMVHAFFNKEDGHKEKKLATDETRMKHG